MSGPEAENGQAAAVVEAVELVMRRHLPVTITATGVVLCICDMMKSFEGPIYQRLHVAEELQKAGLLRGGSS
jgi:hypothetical protein